jgi:LysR family hydrogen peroxide-inducible transcriptional activator
MTLTQLGYIVAIAQHGSFGVAARKCHVTQPTLSMQVQKLEDLLGVIIFDRSKQPVVPTPIGARLVEQARQVLREASRIEEIIKQESGKVSGPFTLGVIPTVAPFLLPLFIRTFAETYPEVELTVEELETAQIVQRLKDDSLDAAILATPLKDPGLVENRLYNEPFFVCLPEGDPLGQKKEIHESDLPLARILLLNEGNCMRDQMLSLCQLKAKARNQSGLKVYFQSGSLATLTRLVEQGAGFTIVPFLALDSLVHTRCVIKPFAPPLPVREISLVVRRSYVKHHILKAIEDALQQSLPKKLRSYQKSPQRVLPFEWS